MHPTRSSLALLTLIACLPAFAKEPADTLTGPPFVTCRAWVIMDGKTGEVVQGLHTDEPQKAASTTKIMCAYLVLQLAEKDPKVMEEVVTFSKFAADTKGSTSEIKEGERLPVSECLYGLLLPSGNDAGNALAEHFNDRFKPLTSGELPGKLTLLKTPRSNFVAEMNRTAARLGMTHTTYRIPYGDGGSDEDMTISPRDLLHLARAAMQNSVFRKYVGTARYEGHVTQPDGSPRTIVWTNTNRLLGTEGYDGVKTGSTTAAGSCLVVSCHRGEDHLFCVVLGSTSDAGRYADTQNLMRWAWLSRGHRAADR